MRNTAACWIRRPWRRSSPSWARNTPWRSSPRSPEFPLSDLFLPSWSQLISSSLLQKIEGINDLWREIASIRVTVPLSMFCLCAGKLNEDLCDRAKKLRNKIIVFKMEENRQLNRG